jgi:DNA-binding transcriptional LysR family regulator
VVARFCRDHGGVEISLETQRLDNLLEYVETGIVDIGFAMEPHPRQTLTYLPLAQLDMVCACPADSPLAQLSFVSPTDLRGTPLINARTSSRISSLIQEAFRRSTIEYAPAIDVRFMNVAGHFAEEGLGVTIMDELTASSKRYSRLRSVPFKPKTEVTVSAIVPSDRMQSRLAQALVKHAREEIAARLAASRQ